MSPVIIFCWKDIQISVYFCFLHYFLHRVAVSRPPTVPLNKILCSGPQHWARSCTVPQCLSRLCTVARSAKANFALWPIAGDELKCLIYQLNHSHNRNDFKPNPDGCKKRCSCAARSHTWLPRWPIGEREAWCHAAAKVGSPTPSFRKS